MPAFNTLGLNTKSDSHKLLLHRFPENKLDKSLRAWDAADEYLISTIKETLSTTEINHISIINDSFGSLTCAMSILFPDASIRVFSDSLMSIKGIKQNLILNNLDMSKIMFMNSLDLQKINEYRSDLIILKIPRTLAYLDYILACVSTTFNTVTPRFISGAMVKLITSSVLKVFDSYFSDTKTSLAKKKARLVMVETAVTNDQIKPFELTKSIHDKDMPFTLHNYPNVFCREQIDIGARFFLQHLPKLKDNQRIIDLGCGNGVLGLSIIKRYIDSKQTQTTGKPKLIFVDESHMALASAKTSCEAFFSIQQNDLVDFCIDHCLSDFLENTNQHNSIDKIVCNPPFHQQTSMLDDIAWQMFVDSKKALKRGGELLVVGNRHLDHRNKLSKLFGGCKIVATNKKFTVFSCIKFN